MTSKIRMKAVKTDEGTQVTAILKHPMETGKRKDPKTGEIIAAHYITEVICQHKGKEILAIDMGPSVSKDAKIKFAFEGGRKGEPVSIAWIDNRGEKGYGESKIR